MSPIQRPPSEPQRAESETFGRAESSYSATVHRYEPDRSIFLTDGVFAIAVTLLALDLKPALRPRHSGSAQLAHYLDQHGGQYVSFLLAFWLIARFWILHHRAMRSVRKLDDVATWSNMLFLFTIICLPVTTYINGDYPSPLATSLFAGNLLLVSLALALFLDVTHRRGLTDAPETRAARRERHWQMVGASSVPAIVIGLAWVVPHAEYFFLLALMSNAPAKIAAR